MKELKELKPVEIVKELNKYVIGQEKAKKSVAIALRNRWRRKQVDKELRDEIAPKNIIMIGATGVGKTEIARRLANLTASPFFKVEASKFTEIGYVGRDVESMIRDLTSITVRKIQNDKREEVQKEAEKIAEEKILDILLPKPKIKKSVDTVELSNTNYDNSREKLRKKLINGELDDRYIDINIAPKNQTPMVEVFSNVGLEDMGINMQEMFSALQPKSSKKQKKTKIKDAKKIIKNEEAENLIDMDKVVKEAIRRVEQSGIVFIDEIDKIAVKNGGSSGGNSPNVSREGVQRDLLPIIEGSSVPSRYGSIKTDHILFIASGAFHLSSPSDLIPELQGRFPIRVELSSLGFKDFVEILTKPKNALILQYIALLKTDGIDLSFEKPAIEEIAKIAEEVNTKTENIGARRLHTIMECLLEDILFEAPDLSKKKIKITKKFVQDKLKDIKDDEDLSRYIL